MENHILEVRNLSKNFGGVQAVHEVNFKIDKNKITAVIGPNGAGKSTLFNLIAGVFPPSSGEVWFEGKLLNKLPAYARISKGLARTFQGVELFSNMTVLENVMVGRHAVSSAGMLHAAFRSPLHQKEEKEIKEASQNYLDFVGLTDKASFFANSIPFGQQRLLAMARAIASEPKLLLLDEPAAGLNHKEKRDLANLIVKLRDRGISVLLVEHDMDLVMGIAEHIIVLDYGEKIAEGNPSEIQNNERVIAAYLGDDQDDLLED